LGIKLGIEIEERKRPLEISDNKLPWTVLGFYDPDPQSFSFSHHLPKCSFENGRINGSSDFDIFRDVEGRTGRIQHLGKPDTRLSGRQTMAFDSFSEFQLAGSLNEDHPTSKRTSCKN
jgi:hypothetical protein